MQDKDYETEITKDMVEAGASVLCGMELAFADEEFWAKEVYRAMVKASSDPMFARRFSQRPL